MGILCAVIFNFNFNFLLAEAKNPLAQRIELGEAMGDPP